MSNEISRWVRRGGARVGGWIGVSSLAWSGPATLSVRAHAVVWPWLLAGALALGCSTDRHGVGAGGESGETNPTSARPQVESAEARAVVQAIRARFRLKLREPAAEGAAGQPRAFRFDRPPVAREALAPSHVNHVDRDGAWLRARLPDSALRGVIHRADVSLPARADGAFHLVDVDSGIAVDVALADASDVAAEVADGFVVYRRGHASGADIVHRVTAEGTEDYFVFEHAPDMPELRYQIALGDKVAGLRLVANTLEMLDAGGAPRLRMAPPYLVDAAGVRREANVAVRGCVHETNRRMQWGQAVKAPGATPCEVRVAWSATDVIYPALVDPMWTATGSMAAGRWRHTASLLSTGINAGKVLVVGGFNGSMLASTEVYDPGTATWSAAQPMGTPRNRHTASVLTSGVNMGKVLVVGGNNQGNLASAELYDPVSNTWSSAANMSAQRADHTASVLDDGRVLVAGGNGNGGPQAGAEIYDPATNTWGDSSIMSAARYYFTATLLKDGRVLVAGGNNGVEVQDSAEIFDPLTSLWSSASNMTIARWDHTATLLDDGRVFVAGTYAGSYPESAEAYDPMSNTWNTLPSMASARAQHTATLLNDGKVLVAGGVVAGEQAEVYDPAANTWGALTVMSDKRVYHTATLLNNGRALVAGGYGINGFLASAEMFASLSQGSACTQMSECLSGFCVDGFCCDTACHAGECDACSTALGATMDGECSLLTGTACNDDNACTQTDTCQGGVCTGANPVICTAFDQCHDVGTCNPVTGVCSAPPKADGSGCNDGYECTTDTCQNGTCIGTPVTCTALNQCRDVGYCNSFTGVCSNPKKANGTYCYDSDACTKLDSCQNGTCVGANPVNCGALDECHDAGMCDPATGVCTNPVKPDGSACENGGMCMGGVCNSGSGGASGTGGGGAAANADSGTFYSCSAGSRVPADPWVGFAAVWGTLALAVRTRRRRR